MVKLFTTILLLFVTVSLQAQEYPVYISSYSKGDNIGLYKFSFNESNGDLKKEEEYKGIASSFYINLSPSKKRMYSVSKDKIQALSVAKKTGKLKLLNTKSTSGLIPVYTSVDKTGKWAFSANYKGGTIDVFPITRRGKVKEKHQSIQYKGEVTTKGTKEKPHPHMIIPAPSNKFVIVTDLGKDRICVYPFNSKTGMLDINAANYIKTKLGAGPRHFIFHKNGRYAYVVNELNSTVTAYHWNALKGGLQEIGSYYMLPKDFTKYSKTADIHISPDGKFLYASNRGHDSITVFKIEISGELKLINQFFTGGKSPNSFVISKNGEYMIVANQKSDNIIIFKINKQKGILSNIKEIKGVKTPICVKYL